MAASINSGGEPEGRAEEKSLNCGLGLEQYLGRAVGFATLANCLWDGFVMVTTFPPLTTLILLESAVLIGGFMKLLVGEESLACPVTSNIILPEP